MNQPSNGHLSVYRAFFRRPFRQREKKEGTYKRKKTKRKEKKRQRRRGQSGKPSSSTESRICFDSTAASFLLFLPLPSPLHAATCAVRAPSSPRPPCRSPTGDGAAAYSRLRWIRGSPNIASNRLRPGATESGCRLAWHSEKREEGLNRWENFETSVGGYGCIFSRSIPLKKEKT